MKKKIVLMIVLIMLLSGCGSNNNSEYKAEGSAAYSSPTECYAEEAVEMDELEGEIEPSASSEKLVFVKFFNTDFFINSLIPIALILLFYSFQLYSI